MTRLKADTSASCRRSARLAKINDEGNKRPVWVSQLFHRLFYSSDPPNIHTSQGRKLVLIHKEPNMYIVEDFLTENETEMIAKHLEGSRLQRSYMNDEQYQQVEDSYRTSCFTYLKKYQNTAVSQIERRAAEMLTIHPHNVEPLQLLSYTEGQKFDVHHDAGNLEDEPASKLAKEAQLRVANCGAPGAPRRIITVFLYLNSLPVDSNTSLAGGETEFPLLDTSGEGIVIPPTIDAPPGTFGRRFIPKRGTAVVWANFLEDGTPDVRTIHRGCPIIGRHRKFGCNIWITDKEQTAHIQATSASGGSGKGRGTPQNNKGHGTPNKRMNRDACLAMADAHCPELASDALCGLCAGLLQPLKGGHQTPSKVASDTTTFIMCCNGCLLGVHTHCQLLVEDVENEQSTADDEASWACWRCRKSAPRKGKTPSRTPAKTNTAAPNGSSKSPSVSHKSATKGNAQASTPRRDKPKSKVLSKTPEISKQSNNEVERPKTYEEGQEHPERVVIETALDDDNQNCVASENGQCGRAVTEVRDNGEAGDATPKSKQGNMAGHVNNEPQGNDQQKASQKRFTSATLRNERATSPTASIESACTQLRDCVLGERIEDPSTLHTEERPAAPGRGYHNTSKKNSMPTSVGVKSRTEEGESPRKRKQMGIKQS